MAKMILIDKKFWWLASVAGSVAWVCIILIAAEINRDFRVFESPFRGNYDLGPAGNSAFFGVVVIFAICLGVPRLADWRRKRKVSVNLPS